MENEILKEAGLLATDKHFAVGNDLVFIPDFQTSFTDAFKNRVYTANEIAYCDLFDDSLLRYASTWAAKEAVYKALKQVDARAIAWEKIEILREKIAGQPHVIVHTKPDLEISLSISHDGDYVWAVAFYKKIVIGDQ